MKRPTHDEHPPSMAPTTIVAATLLLQLATASACIDDASPPAGTTSSALATRTDAARLLLDPTATEPLVLGGNEVVAALVTVHAVSVQSPDTGWHTVADFGVDGRVVDMLSLAAGSLVELGAFDLPPGPYTQIRVDVGTDNYVLVHGPDGDDIRPLTIPSDEADIHIVQSFEIANSGISLITVAFDPGASLFYNKGRGYMLKPTMRVTDVAAVDVLAVPIEAASGGTVSILGHASVVVPPGALAADTDITILPVGPPTSMPFSTMHLFGEVYDLGPDGLTFESPVTVALDYDDADIAALGLNEAELQVHYQDAGTGAWIAVESSVDTDTNTVSAAVAHFTPFVIGGPPATRPLIENIEVIPVASATDAGQIPHRVRARIVDPDSAGIISAALYFRHSGTMSYDSLFMTPVGGDLYEATLPSSPFLDLFGPHELELVIQATDADLEVSFAPPTAPGTPYAYAYEADVDGDGMNDRWEYEVGLNVGVDDAAEDPDGDWFANVTEYGNGTLPLVPDYAPEEHIAADTHKSGGDLFTLLAFAIEVTNLPTGSESVTATGTATYRRDFLGVWCDPYPSCFPIIVHGSLETHDFSATSGVGPLPFELEAFRDQLPDIFFPIPMTQTDCITVDYSLTARSGAGYEATRTGFHWPVWEWPDFDDDC